MIGSVLMLMSKDKMSWCYSLLSQTPLWSCVYCTLILNGSFKHIEVPSSGFIWWLGCKFFDSWISFSKRLDCHHPTIYNENSIMCYTMYKKIFAKILFHVTLHQIIFHIIQCKNVSFVLYCKLLTYAEQWQII